MSNDRSVTELNDIEIDAIIHLYLNGFPNDLIANRYNVSLNEINEITKPITKFKSRKHERKFYNINLLE